jgi:hypothetical protein
MGLAATAVAETIPTEGPGAPAESREVFGLDAPRWLLAVGKLQVPGNRFRDGRRTHLLEDCSATLLSGSPGSKADIIVTAWHCLADYRDVSKAITFTLPPREGDEQEQVRQAYRLADGGGMHADWAILRLYHPITDRALGPLGVHPGRADPDQAIIMAGYSRDSGMGKYGDRLTFDPACRITGQFERTSDSNCQAHKGASGGPVVQLSDSGRAQLSGVISTGDGAGYSTFVPVEVFRHAIIRYLGRAQP